MINIKVRYVSIKAAGIDFSPRTYQYRVSDDWQDALHIGDVLDIANNDQDETKTVVITEVLPITESEKWFYEKEIKSNGGQLYDLIREWHPLDFRPARIREYNDTKGWYD